MAAPNIYIVKSCDIKTHKDCGKDIPLGDFRFAFSEKGLTIASKSWQLSVNYKNLKVTAENDLVRVCSDGLDISFSNGPRIQDLMSRLQLSTADLKRGITIDKKARDTAKYKARSTGNENSMNGSLNDLNNPGPKSNSNSKKNKELIAKESISVGLQFVKPQTKGMLVLKAEHAQAASVPGVNPQLQMKQYGNITTKTKRSILSSLLPGDARTLARQPSSSLYNLDQRAKAASPHPVPTQQPRSLHRGSVNYNSSRPFAVTPSKPNLAKATQPQFSLFFHLKSKATAPTVSPDISLVGMRNLGNTCYMNAVLQALLVLPDFTDDITSNFWTTLYPERDVPPTVVASQVSQSILRSPLKSTATPVSVSLDGSTKSCFAAMGDLIRHSRRVHGVLDTAGVKAAVDGHSQRFIGSSQEDAHEFLLDFINAIHEDSHSRLLKSWQEFERAQRSVFIPTDVDVDVNTDASTSTAREEASKPPSTFLPSALCDLLPTSHHFHAEVNVHIKCKSCGNQSEPRQEFFRDFSVELDDGGSACGSSGTSSSGDGVKSEPLELADALTNFFATEERDLRCSVCEGPHDKALVSARLSTLPRVLLVHLKRFRYEPRTKSFQKVLRPVNFPTVLDISPVCEPMADSATDPGGSSNDAAAPRYQADSESGSLHWPAPSLVDLKSSPHEAFQSLYEQGFLCHEQRDCINTPSDLTSGNKEVGGENEIYVQERVPVSEDTIDTGPHYSVGLVTDSFQRTGGSDEPRTQDPQDSFATADWTDRYFDPHMLVTTPYSTRESSSNRKRPLSVWSSPTTNSISTTSNSSSTTINSSITNNNNSSTTDSISTTSNSISTTSGTCGRTKEKADGRTLTNTSSQESPLRQRQPVSLDAHSAEKRPKAVVPLGVTMWVDLTDWTCHICTLDNSHNVTVCEACHSSRPQDISVVSAAPETVSSLAGTKTKKRRPDTQSPDQFHQISTTTYNTPHIPSSNTPASSSTKVSKQSREEWSCSQCTLFNRITLTACDACGTTRPELSESAESPAAHTGQRKSIPVEADPKTSSALADKHKGTISESSGDEVFTTSSSEGLSCDGEPPVPRRPLYRLCGVVRHHGSKAFAGHYTCDKLIDLKSLQHRSPQVDAKSSMSPQWLRCNDSTEAHIHEAEVLKQRESPYILVYSLISPPDRS